MTRAADDLDGPPPGPSREDDDTRYGLGSQNGASDDDGMVPLIDWSENDDDHHDEIVDGLIRPGRWTQFPAPAKAGKSTLLVSMTLDLSEGIDPLDGTRTDPVTVLYLDGEMGRADLADLIGDCGRDPRKLTHWFGVDSHVRLDDAPDATRLLRRVDHLAARVVVLDGLNSFVSPAASENDDSTWRRFYEMTVRNLKLRGVAVVSGDNMGKDTTRGARGSSVKADKPDAVFELHRTDSGLTLKGTHRRGGSFAELVTLEVVGLDRSEPIRYQRAAGSWPAGTAAAAEMLDQLGVPTDHGRDRVRARLREEVERAKASDLSGDEFRVSNDALAAALRFRRLPRPGAPS